MEETSGLLKSQRVSVVIPCCNEADNMQELLEDLGTVSSLYGFFEVVLVDDGSEDGTYDKANAFKEKYPFLRTFRHRRNFGLTIALNTGFKESKGDILVFWPGDLQFKAHDLPKLTEALTDGVDMACGKKEGHYEKRLVSGIYNALVRKMFGVKVTDQNSVKAFRKEMLENMKLRSSWHRYIVAIASFYGYNIVEVPVKLYPRLHGESKLSSKGRIVVGLLDLISVKVELDYSLRPMILFGFPGIIVASIGVIIGVIYFSLKLFFVLSPDYKITILLFIVMIFIVGVNLFCFGVICDVLKGIMDKQKDQK